MIITQNKRMGDLHLQGRRIAKAYTEGKLVYTREQAPVMVLVCDIPSSSLTLSLADRLREVDDSTSVKINWGDGTPETTYSLIDPGAIEHTYPTAGEYHVQIKGKIKWVCSGHTTNLGSVVTNILLPTGHSPIYALEPEIINNIAYGWAFYRFTRLTALPQGLLDNCPADTILHGMCNDCRELRSVPFDLLHKFTETTKFSSVFHSCSKLTAPPDLSRINPNATTFAQMFQSCTALTTPLPELWKTHPQASGTYCFYGCTQAPNYAEALAAGWA